MLLRKLPFARLVREIGNLVAPEPFRWTAEALLALQEVRAFACDSISTARPIRLADARRARRTSCRYPAGFGGFHGGSL